MNGVEFTGAASHVGAPVAAGSSLQLAGESTLLPPPEDMSGDPLMALLLLQRHTQKLDTDAGIKDVLNNQRLRKEAWKEYKSAMRKAQQAKKKGGFWRKAAKLCNKLGKYGAVVAAVAIAVGTGGVGAPASLAIVGAVMSSASLVQSETQFLQKMGMSDSLASKVEVGLSVGGAVCSGGAAALGGLSSVNQASEAVEVVQKGAAVTSGAASLTGGVATIQAGRHEGEEREHRADALTQRLEEQRLQRLFSQTLELLQGDQDSDKRAVEALHGAIEARDSTREFIARRV